MDKPLKIVFNDIKKEAQKRLDALDEFSPLDNTERRPFLEAVIITADAIILWAERHAELAAQKAAAEVVESAEQESAFYRHGGYIEIC